MLELEINRDKWRDRDISDYVRIKDKWRDRDISDYVRRQK